MKRVLLDTHVLLWWLDGGQNLNDRANVIIRNSRNSVYVSAASVWEIAIKQGLGKLDAPDNIVELIEASGFEELLITSFHAYQAGTLLTDHKDPFDRMLISQAQAEGLTLITHDKAILGFGIRCIDPI